MDDTRGSKRRALLAALVVGILTAVLLIKSSTPAMFFSWFASLLGAFFLLLLMIVAFTLVIIVIATVIRHYIKGRFPESKSTDNASRNQPVAPLQRSNGRYTLRQPTLKPRPPKDHTENGC